MQANMQAKQQTIKNSPLLHAICWHVAPIQSKIHSQFLTGARCKCMKCNGCQTEVLCRMATEPSEESREADLLQMAQNHLSDSEVLNSLETDRPCPADRQVAIEQTKQNWGVQKNVFHRKQWSWCINGASWQKAPAITQLWSENRERNLNRWSQLCWGFPFCTCLFTFFLPVTNSIMNLWAFELTEHTGVSKCWDVTMVLLWTAEKTPS